MKKKIIRIISLILVTVLVVIALLAGFATSVGASSNSRTATIFLGDSRTVGMDLTLGLSSKPDTFVVAKTGMGYNWLTKTAIPELERIESENNYDKYIIICNLGVNDLGNIDKYVDMIPTLESFGTLYYVSVNPTVDEVKGVQCKDIEEFNSKLKPHVSRYVDCYSYLKNVGYYAKDGMHFDAATYNNIYNYIMLNVSTWEYLSTNNKGVVTEKDVQSTYCF